MICHRTETAEEAARAIAELPHWMTEEAHNRIERFRRKKLHGPLAWSDRKWEETTAALARLAAEFAEDPGPAAGSPVAAY